MRLRFLSAILDIVWMTSYVCRSFRAYPQIHTLPSGIGRAPQQLSQLMQIPNSICDYRDGINGPNRTKSSVAIIGGGIAGLSCATELQQSYDVTVYDTGRLRPGGRASSRHPNDPAKENQPGGFHPILTQYLYDHAAQFISSNHRDSSTSSQQKWRRSFDNQVETWVDQGILKEVPSGCMFVVKKNGPTSWKLHCMDEGNPSVRFYYPSQGMSSLAQALMKGGSFKVEQNVWVSPSSGVRYLTSPTIAHTGEINHGGRWQLRAHGRILGEFGHLVLAHNGKCADRLMSQTPATDIHNMLRGNFSDRVPASGGQKMTLNSLFSLTIAVKSPSSLRLGLPDGLLAAFTENHPTLSLLTCQTRKYPLASYDRSNSSHELVEVWNILSTASFAKKHKAPQEFLPQDVISNVTRLLVEALDDIVDISEGTAGSLLEQVLDFRLQLWGAAVPINVWKSDDASHFLYDPKYQVGVCGDWLVEPSIAGAWTSGRQMALHLKQELVTDASFDSTHEKVSKPVGLSGRFQVSHGVKKLGIALLDGPVIKNCDDTDSMSTSKRTPNGRYKKDRQPQGR